MDENFFKYLGLFIFVCFLTYLLCKTVSFNYSLVEGMVNAKDSKDIAGILKNGGDGGRVGMDHDKIIKNLDENRILLKKMLQLPQDTGKLQEQLDDFKENIGLEELKLLNEASSKECSAGKLVAIGKQLKAYKRIGTAIDNVKLDKSSGWL